MLRSHRRLIVVLNLACLALALVNGVGPGTIMALISLPLVMLIPGEGNAESIEAARDIGLLPPASKGASDGE